MKKTYKMALVSALTLFSLSATPLVLHDHLNVVQAATTKKTHHKKVRKHTTKKHKVTRRKVTKKKTAKKLRHKKIKKHAIKRINHKRLRKAIVKKQNNVSANVSDIKSQSNLNSNSNYANHDVDNSSNQNNSNIDDVNNYIKVPDDYFIKFVNGKYEINGQVETDSDSDQNFNLPVKKFRSAYKINHFYAHKPDKKIRVDYNHLTYQQEKYLSQYTANIINNVRHQITNNNPISADLTVDDNTINFANDIVKAYNHDNWSIAIKCHDCKAINKISNDFGLVYTQDNVQYYEDASEGYLPDNSKTNLSTIKQAIYNSIMDMLFDDAYCQWGHAFSFIGTYYPNQKSDTFAIGFDKLGQIHFEIIPYDLVRANETAE